MVLTNAMQKEKLERRPGVEPGNNGFADHRVNRLTLDA